MYYFLKDKGQIRERNEDNCDVFEINDITFMLVLDGMGGHNKGDTASSLALKVIKEKLEKKQKYLSKNTLKHYMIKAIKKANKEVNILGNSLIEYADMGTTLIFVAITSDYLVMCNIGDSRCYLYNGGKFTQISEDQTYVEFLYKTGKITLEEKKTHPKKHILMNALGTYPSLSVATKIIKKPFEKVLLCSDGLYNMVEDEIVKNVLEKQTSAKEKVEELVALSNLNGGIDNIAIALWEEK